MRINSSRQGSLYEKQPLAIEGNLHNKTYPDQKVLGFFSASSVKSKRIFVKKVEDLEIKYFDYCIPARITSNELATFSPEDYPLYFNDKGFLGKECVDCLSFGGTNIKPDFWP